MPSRAGRKPEPTSRKILKGTFGSREKKARANEPTPGKGEPSCPDSMPAAGREFFHRMGAELRAMKMFHACDAAAFLAACSAWAQWQKCEVVLERDGLTQEFETKTGATYSQQRPEVSILMQARKACVDFCREFGLTPTSRAKASAAEPGDQPKDPWDDL